MDQCSWHDTPPAFSVDLTNRSGRALRLELVVQIVLALTDQRFGDIFTKVTMSCTIRLLKSALRWLTTHRQDLECKFPWRCLEVHSEELIGHR